MKFKFMLTTLRVGFQRIESALSKEYVGNTIFMLLASIRTTKSITNKLFK